MMLLKFLGKLLGKLLILPLILVFTILFYIATIFSRIYGVVALVYNILIGFTLVASLVLQQWRNFWIALALLVISYLLLGLWDIITGFFAWLKIYFTGLLFA